MINEAEMRYPDICVIVATRNRAHAIGQCLAAIEHAFHQCPGARGTIIVVNNASTDDTEAVVNDWAKTASIPVSLHYEAKKGLSAARNCGIRHAKGDLIVFTDDDCCLSPTYISELLQYDRQDEELTLRSGSVVLGDPTDLPLTIKIVTETRTWKRLMNLADEGDLLGNALIGCNMAMRRGVIDRVGLFDERLGAGTSCCAAEDTDYYYRAYLAGLKLQVVPDLMVSHFHGRKTPGEKVKLEESYAVGNGALVAKYLFVYPNFSRHFYWNVKKYIELAVSPRKRREQVMPPAGWDIPQGRLLRLQCKGIFNYMRARAGL